MSTEPRFWLGVAFCSFGWISSLSYSFHLLAPHYADCEGGNALPYLVSLIAGPTTLLLASLLLTAGAALGVTARWPALLHLLTAGVAATVLPGYLADTTVDGAFICTANAAGGPSDFAAPLWQRAWVPVQNAALVAFALFLLWYWRRGSRLPLDAEAPP